MCYVARVCDISIVGKPSIACNFPCKKHSIAESVATSALLCVPKHMSGGSQTHPQQRSIAYLYLFLKTLVYRNSSVTLDIS
uniref:SFRICE_005309 n=1 Tax=Spodoptera frugiperda TaxID=7108 RepID=A0A2H1WIE9_SPOFR